MSQPLLEWCDESIHLLGLWHVGFELSISALPHSVPSKYELMTGGVATFNSWVRVDDVEREIADAFFLRLKGIVESRLRLRFKPNWKDTDSLLESIKDRSGQQPNLSDDDRNRLDQFCALRNCIAHHDGIVDEKLCKKILDLRIGTQVWHNRDTVRNWYGLCLRLFQAIQSTRYPT